MRRLALLSMFLLGCESSTTPGAGGVDVVGTWRLSATQIFPALEITGEMRIQHQNGSSVSGEVETREQSADGMIRNHVASLSGRVLADDTVDFDVFIDPEPRRHVGRVRGDTIAGSWAQSTGGVPLTGAFTLQKVKP